MTMVRKAKEYQIAVPTIHRQEVLELEHDLPMSGHFQIRKTYITILQLFYWPGLKKYVTWWCKECHTFQLGGNPNQNMLLPFTPHTSFGEPFSHIIIYCVGPYPKPSHKMSIC